MTMGAQEAVWLCQLLQELNPTALPPIHIHCKDIKIATTMQQDGQLPGTQDRTTTTTRAPSS
jgi:hypothetical protein